MRLLLDTHALQWFCEGSSELSPAARSAMEDGRNECYVSHATAWEIAVKTGLGKLELRVLYGELFPSAVLANGFSMLTPDVRHYGNLIQLPQHHRDPFDRLLIAQAMSENLTIVTCDPHFPAYGVPILW
jgi:PIN domain nuclease of toxin-antitoxin system